MMKNSLIVAFIMLPFLGAAQYPSQILFYDSIDFESTVNNIIIPPTGCNMWEIDQPQKTVFDSAYSPVNVIVTDNVNPYQENSTSVFEFYYTDTTHMGMPFGGCEISFKHKYHTDGIHAGGFIEFSYDGIHYDNLIDAYNMFIPYNQQGLYGYNDTIYDGTPAFRGQSNGWEDFSVTFYWLALVKMNMYDTIHFRFVFEVDSTHNLNYEGWMIDDIHFVFLEAMGSVEEEQGMQFSVSPNPASHETMIRLDHNEREMLSLWSMDGKLIDRFEARNGDRLPQQFLQLPHGIYLLKRKEFDSEHIKLLIP